MKTPDNVRRYQREYQYRKGIKCLVCGKPITRQAQYCNKHTPRPWIRKERHSIADCKRYRDKAGYINLYYPEHPNADKSGRVGEHIVIWTEANGRLPTKWQVHHINGIKDDNRPENLIALPPKAHRHSSPIKLLLKRTQARIRQLETQLNNQLHFQ